MKKKIFTLLLTSIIFFQLQSQKQSEFLDMNIPLDLKMDYETNQSKGPDDKSLNISKLFLVIEFIFEQKLDEETSNTTKQFKYLSTLHITDFTTSTLNQDISKTALISTLTFNHETENTFFSWLNPISTVSRNLHNAQYIPKGFGPAIRI